MHRGTLSRGLCAALPLASLLACADAPETSRQAVRALVAEPLAAETGPRSLPPARPAPPPAPRERMPRIIRGIYVNAYAAANPQRRAALLALTDSSELNAWVVDVKDEDGVRYRSGVPEARAAAHERSIPLHDLRALADTLRARGIHPIARIVVFKDPRLARARPELAIRRRDGGVWRDRQGLPWVSPWDRRAWEINLAVAEEAAAAGFREIQFDYIRFPEAYASLGAQVHLHADGERADAIEGFLAEARRRLHPRGVAVSADVFGLATTDPRDVGIGHQWERLSAAVDHLLPMVYPSHYFPTHLSGIRRPNRMPFETVHRALTAAVLRGEAMAEAGTPPARVIPWLQAFTATWNDRGYPYGAEQAAAQIRAVYAVGLEDWIFWHPGSRYDAVAAAFARETVSRADAAGPEGRTTPQPAEDRHRRSQPLMNQEGPTTPAPAVVH